MKTEAWRGRSRERGRWADVGDCSAGLRSGWRRYGFFTEALESLERSTSSADVRDHSILPILEMECAEARRLAETSFLAGLRGKRDSPQQIRLKSACAR
jgi:hypothetical protein